MQKTIPCSSAETFTSGSIPAGIISYANLRGAPLPMTLTLTSTADGREIAISMDETNYIVPSYDATATAFISVAITSPIAGVRFTGALNDTWSVR